MGHNKNKQADATADGATQPSFGSDPSNVSDNDVIPPTGTDPHDAKLNLTLKEIRVSRTALEARMDTMSTNLSLLQADHKKLADKVKSNKLALNDVIPQQTMHSTQLEQFQRQLEGLQDRVDDAEGRSCRNNVRILGIPERSEGSNPTQFVEDWLRDHFAKEDLTPLYSVERVHRVPPRPPQPGVPPRPLIARILHYKYRDTILRAARENAPVQFENKTI